MMKATRISVFVVVTLACGAALSDSVEGAVVLDQIGDENAYDLGAVSGPSPSQIFTDFPSYDCTVLEDFTVSTAELRITQVSALFRAQGGFLSFQDVQGYYLNFFRNPLPAPISLKGDVASRTVIAGSGASVTQIIDGTGAYEYGLVSLNVDITMPSAGNYWVAVSPVSALSVTGQFLLMTSSATGSGTTGNANGKLANPGLGLGAGALSSLGADYAYTVTAVPEPATLVLCFLGSLACLRRRRPA